MHGQCNRGADRQLIGDWCMLNMAIEVYLEAGIGRE